MKKDKTTNLKDLREDMLNYLIKLFEEQEKIKITYQITKI
jgi:hypothetical protein